VSTFADVDRTEHPERLVSLMELADAGMVEAKARLRRGLGAVDGARVIDVGCGAGQELVRLVRAGAIAVGVDRSSVMLAAAGDRLAAEGLARVPLVHADAARLPLPDRSLDVGRIERVLQHVPEPAAVLHELRRVLRPGGRLAVVEPDWSSFALASARPATTAAVCAQAGARIAHRDVGRQLPRLLVEAGFTGIRWEIELMQYQSPAELEPILPLTRLLERAVSAGLDPDEAADWLAEQHELGERGGFAATLHRCVLAWAEVPR
jgi:SAM-dependent methyltransferase